MIKCESQKCFPICLNSQADPSKMSGKILNNPRSGPTFHDPILKKTSEPQKIRPGREILACPVNRYFFRAIGSNKSREKCFWVYPTLGREVIDSDISESNITISFWIVPELFRGNNLIQMKMSNLIQNLYPLPDYTISFRAHAPQLSNSSTHSDAPMHFTLVLQQ